MLNDLIFMIPAHILLMLPLVILALLSVMFSGFSFQEKEPEFFARNGNHGHNHGFADQRDARGY